MKIFSLWAHAPASFFFSPSSSSSFHPPSSSSYSSPPLHLPLILPLPIFPKYSLNFLPSIFFLFPFLSSSPPTFVFQLLLLACLVQSLPLPLFPFFFLFLLLFNYLFPLFSNLYSLGLVKYPRLSFVIWTS